MTDQKETQKPANQRGHNAMVTGLAVLVIGGLIFLTQMGRNPGMSGFGILVAVAGLVVWLIGIGMRRER